MPWVGIKPRISVFERAKIFHGLDHAAIVIGMKTYRGMEVHLHELLASVLNGGKWAALHSEGSTPGEDLSIHR
jgi:hypothetical protein